MLSVDLRIIYRSIQNFAGCNSREFCDKGRVRENLFEKFNMGGYEMPAVVSKTNFRLFVIKLSTTHS